MNLCSYMTPHSDTGTPMFHLDWEERVRWAFVDMESPNDTIVAMCTHALIHRLTSTVIAVIAVTVESRR